MNELVLKIGVSLAIYAKRATFITGNNASVLLDKMQIPQDDFKSLISHKHPLKQLGKERF